MKYDFEIPLDVKSDLIYCQQAMANHITVHQKISTLTTFMNFSERQVKKTLEEIEREILDIGNEQKLLFNRLRFFIDCHQIMKNLSAHDREVLTKQIRDELANHAANCRDAMRPKNVQRRLSSSELFSKYVRTKGGSETPSPIEMVKETKDEPADDEVETILLPTISNGNPPAHSNGTQKLSRIPTSKIDDSTTIKPQSLLKPMNQRQGQPAIAPIITSPPKEEPMQATRISQCRNNLMQALFKAKDNKLQNNRVTTESPDPVSVVRTESPSSVRTVSSASNSSSDDVEVKDELTPNDLGQESFLRLFGLFTPSYCHYLQNRRPLRYKRSCTSTKRGDFHYGKFELFERQFSKRSPRHFLYSPPATRAKRRIESTIEKPVEKKELCIMPKRHRSNASSNSSLSSQANVNRVCVSCYKQNNLLECKCCCGQYHLNCHSNSATLSVRRLYCPECCKNKISLALKQANHQHKTVAVK